MLARKVSVYEYYCGLIHMTDNMEVDLPKTQYCVNLPEDWKDNTKKEEHFIHQPVLAVDTNFRMNSRDKLSEKADPGLHTGLAYYVKHDDYVKHVHKYASQKDISSCSSFRTLAHAESKYNKGLHATDIAGDLQVRERYCNMDYITGSVSKAFNGCKEIFFSYDISSRFHDDLALDFSVPKLHCKAHKYACQCQFLMNLKPGVGQTDGEGVEWTWDDMNPCASSTKEMGPGAQHNTIDDQFRGYNFRKMVNTGDLLHEKLECAVQESARQATIHIAFTESLPTDKNWVQEWTRQVETWEQDSDATNPYFKEAKHAYLLCKIE
ncbi:hypothetical protein IW262DRAFT_1451047 [Armillaria fumosa]|nr:hypothetical protein IW262DRAFT_1451047 [Armillaria fumosa]